MLVGGMDEYKLGKEIGYGGFGVVHLGHNSRNEAVAIKVMKTQPGKAMSRTAMREISILKEMQHPNIVRLLDVVVKKDDVSLVFEHLDRNLVQHMELQPEFMEDQHQVKMFLHQILHGLEHCHSHRILHRDLKPGNLLVDSRANIVKLADFGMARACSFYAKTITPQTVTQAYRAPEILVGSANYSTPADVWSVGCIFAEMVRGSVLFRGVQISDIVENIFSVMGTPNDDTWPRVIPKKDLKTVVPGLEPAGIDLLSKMLYVNPNERITARDALDHEYFRDITSVI